MIRRFGTTTKGGKRVGFAIDIASDELATMVECFDGQLTVADVDELGEWMRDCVQQTCDEKGQGLDLQMLKHIPEKGTIRELWRFEPGSKPQRQGIVIEIPIANTNPQNPQR